MMSTLFFADQRSNKLREQSRNEEGHNKQNYKDVGAIHLPNE
jgi:hypothetical protein